MNLVNFPLLLLLIILSNLGYCYGQSYHLQINTVNQNTPITDVLETYDSLYTDKKNCQKALPFILQQLHQKGYLTASFDSVQYDKNRAIAFLWLGEQYTFVRLHTDSIPAKTLAKIGFNPVSYTNKPIQFSKIRRLQEQLLTYSENNGYPFATTSLQSFTFDNEQVEAYLQLDKHRLITIDSLIFQGTAKISERYLQNYLGIKPNQPYSEKNIRAIAVRIKELAFLQEQHPALLTFIENKAKVQLFLRPKKASKFNVLLGVAPKNDPTLSAGQRQQLQITGEGDLHLQNALGQGEVIGASFKSYPQNVLSLNAQVNYPYLPLLPIGTDLQFDLYIRDTLYRDVTNFISLQYRLKGNNSFKAFFKTKTTTLLSVDSIQILQSKKLPNNLDNTSQLYGITYNFEQLDYRFNPRKGWIFSIDAGVGNKRFIPNNKILALGDAIDTVDFAIQYQQFNQQNALQYQLGGQLHVYWPIGKQSTIQTAIDIGWLSPQDTLQSDLYRIGGTQLLRGFDDQSILTQKYGVVTIAYRYLLGTNAHAALFTDIAYLDSPLYSGQLQWAFGIGSGLTFETKAGVFAINYAFGSRQDNWPNPTKPAINLRESRVHFGYVSYF